MLHEIRAVRAGLGQYPMDDLMDALDAAVVRRTVLERVSAGLLEEMIGRLVAEQFPDAHMVTVVEDSSHDQPHGHFHSAETADGDLLVAGMSDEWHDLPWARSVDDCVYDLYRLQAHWFLPQPDGGPRTYSFPVRQQPE